MPAPQIVLDLFKSIVTNALGDGKPYIKISMNRVLTLTETLSYKGIPIHSDEQTLESKTIDRQKILLDESFTQEDFTSLVSNLKNSESLNDALTVIEMTPDLAPKMKERMKHTREIHELVRQHPELAESAASIIEDVIELNWNHQASPNQVKLPLHIQENMSKARLDALDFLNRVVSDASTGNDFDYQTIVRCLNKNSKDKADRCSYLAIFSDLRISAAKYCEQLKSEASKAITQSEEKLQSLFSELNAETIMVTLKNSLQNPACQQALMLMITQYAKQIMNDYGTTSATEMISESCTESTEQFHCKI